MMPSAEDRQEQAPQPTSMAELAPKSQPRATVELIKVLSDHPEHAPYLKQLIEAEAMRDLFDQDFRTARMYALSGKFDDIKGSTPEQAICAAMTKIRIGREWGMNESDSIAFIYFTNGRPAVMTEILATKIQQAGYSWDIEWQWTEDQHKGKTWRRCTGCTLWLKVYDQNANRYVPVLDRNDQPVSASFTEADAEHATIWEKGQQIPLSSKWNFKSWGQDMYFWRAMSRLRKYYLTGVMRGAVQLELASELLPPPPRAELPPADETLAVVDEDRKSLRDRIISSASATEQGDLLDPEQGKE